MNELVAQVFGCLAVVFWILGYQMKSRKLIITVGVISRALYVIQYIILGAYSGAVLDVASIAVAVLAGRKGSAFSRKYRKIIVPVSILFLVAM